MADFEQILADEIGCDNINVLEFPDKLNSGRSYKFDINYFEDLGVIQNTAQHVIKCFKHQSNGIKFVAKSMTIPSRWFRNNSVRNKREIHRLIDEIKIFQRMKSNCEHIVSFYGIGIYESEIFICMEYMDLNLRNLYEWYYSKYDLFPEDIISFIAIAMVDALGWCYKNRIMHRDVKPANILLNFSGKIKLCDFGVSKVIESNKIFC